jgi:sRNA-binding protein
MNYHFSRDDKEIIVRKLVEHFPKCFFDEPRMRLPLKKGIITDLEKVGFPFTYEEILAGLDWYRSHIGYQYALQAGRARIDLTGEPAGTVTQMEGDQAQRKIREIRKLIRQRDNPDATQTVVALYNAGRIPDDQLRKLDAPTMTTETPPPAPSSSKLAKLQEALEAASPALNGTNTDALQAAIARAALGVLIAEAQRLCEELAGDNGRG